MLGLSALFAVSATVAVAQGQTFNQIDRDRSGTLDPAELQAAFGAAGNTTLAAYDRDGDGTLSLDEASRSGGDDADGDIGDEGEEVARDTHSFSPDAQRALSKFDENGDGMVTRNEVRASDDAPGDRGRDSDRGDSSGRDSGGRDSGGRDSGGRDAGGRDSGGRGNDGGHGKGNGGDKGKGRGRG